MSPSSEARKWVVYSKIFMSVQAVLANSNKKLNEVTSFWAALAIKF